MSIFSSVEDGVAQDVGEDLQHIGEVLLQRGDGGEGRTRLRRRSPRQRRAPRGSRRSGRRSSSSFRRSARPGRRPRRARPCRPARPPSRCGCASSPPPAAARDPRASGSPCRCRARRARAAGMVNDRIDGNLIFFQSFTWAWSDERPAVTHRARARTAGNRRAAVSLMVCFSRIFIVPHWPDEPLSGLPCGFGVDHAHRAVGFDEGLCRHAADVRLGHLVDLVDVVGTARASRRTGSATRPGSRPARGWCPARGSGSALARVFTIASSSSRDRPRS